MQSTFLIAIENKNTHSPNRERWVYASESFLGKREFISWEKKGKGVLRFKSEDEARNWWNVNQNSFNMDDVNKKFGARTVHVMKRIWPSEKENRRAVCRIIKPM